MRKKRQRRQYGRLKWRKQEENKSKGGGGNAKSGQASSSSLSTGRLRGAKNEANEE